MKQIAILDDYMNTAQSSADWHSIPNSELTVFNEHIESEEKLADVLSSFEIIVIMRERTPFPKSLLDRLPNLELLVTTGMRNLAVDMDTARDNGVIVCGTQMMRNAAFELTWALIMSVTKQIPAENSSMHSGGWHQAVGVGLKGKTLGILGLGSLGSEVAKIGAAFEMSVIAWSENLTDERAAEVGVTKVSKTELFSQSDVLTVHLLLSDRTRGIVGEEELSLMKPTAYLVNTARGPIINEGALIQALKQKKIAGAALDVFDVEPLPKVHPLRKLDNAILTGHMGYAIQELYELAYGQAVENIIQWMNGTPTRILNASEK